MSSIEMSSNPYGVLSSIPTENSFPKESQLVVQGKLSPNSIYNSSHLSKSISFPPSLKSPFTHSLPSPFSHSKLPAFPSLNPPSPNKTNPPIKKDIGRIPKAQNSETNISDVENVQNFEKSNGADTLLKKSNDAKTISDNFENDVWKKVPTKLAIFVSGGGSNFKAIHRAILDEKIFGQIVCVVTDRPECGGSKYAIENGINVLYFPQTKFCADALSSQQLIDSLNSLDVDFIILAGFLRLLPVDLVKFYSNSILNIHPSLLPAFGGKGYYGLKVHQAVVASGARYSGATVHFVDEKYDNGAIVAQAIVHVSPFDSPEDLQKRVLKEEHKLFVNVISALCNGCIKWTEIGVPYISSPCANSNLI